MKESDGRSLSVEEVNKVKGSELVLEKSDKIEG